MHAHTHPHTRTHAYTCTVYVYRTSSLREFSESIHFALSPQLWAHNVCSESPLSLDKYNVISFGHLKQISRPLPTSRKYPTSPVFLGFLGNFMVRSRNGVERFRANLCWRGGSLEEKLRPLSLIQLGWCCAASNNSRSLLLSLSSRQRLAVVFGFGELSEIVFGIGQELWWLWEKEGMGVRTWEVLDRWNGIKKR